MDATARLAQEGDEWLPNRDYELLQKIGGAGAGESGEGTESIIFKIRMRRPPQEEYALKQVVLLDGRGEYTDDAALNAKLGKEWRVALSLPPHDCIVPVLHHYHSGKPSLKDSRWGLPGSTEIECLLRDAAATRTLFVVMPLYRTSLRAWVTRQRDVEGLAAPYGMTWQWWGKLLSRMLGAVQHLIKNGAVHGDIKDDQWFLCDGFEQTAEVVLGDLGEAWRTVNADGSARQLVRADYERRAGVGVHKAPELREARQGEFSLGTPLSQVYARAESFTVGVMMYGLLDCWNAGRDDVFHRAARVGGAELPGCAWADEEMPSLPPDCPSWLSTVIQGLARSGATGDSARLSPAQAIDMLGVDQVAMTMEQLDQSRAATAAVERRLEAEQQQLETLRRQGKYTSSHRHNLVSRDNSETESLLVMTAAESAAIQRREAAEREFEAEERVRQAGAEAEQMAEEAQLREQAEAWVSAEAAAAVAEKEAEVRALQARIASIDEGSMEERLRLAEEEKEQAVQSARDWQAAAQARDKAAANAGGAAVAAGLLESVAAGGAQLLEAAGGAIQQRWQQQDSAVSLPPPIGEPVAPGASEAAAELEEVSWAQFEILNGRQHLLIAYRSGGVQLWDLDDDVEAGRDLRGGSGVSSEGAGVAARLVLSRRRVGDPGEVVRCGVCLDAPDDGGDNVAVLLALSMTLPEGTGGLIRFLPVPGVGELLPLQTLAPVDSFLANANVLVAMMGGSQPVVRVWTRHAADARHPNPAGVLTESFEMAAEPTSASSAPPVSLSESWLAFAAPAPDEAASNGCPEAQVVKIEPAFVTTTTSQAVEAADAAVGYLDGATRWLAGAARSTLAPHITALVAGEVAEAEPEPEPEAEPIPPPPVEPPTWDGHDLPAESGWVGVKHAVGKAWIAHFRAATTPVVAVQFSRSGRLLAVVANDGRDIELWKLQPHPGRAAGVDLPVPAVCIGHMSRGSRPSTVVDLCFSMDERHLAVCSGGQGTVHVFALRPVVTGHAYRHTAHAKVHLPSLFGLDLGLSSWMGGGGMAAAEGAAAGTVTPLRAAFAPPAAPMDEHASRAARLLVLSPPGHLRLVALEPIVGGEESGTLSAVALRDDGAAAVSRRRLDPDISTAPTSRWTHPRDGEFVLEGDEGAGPRGGMLGVVNIDDHFEVPDP